MDFSGKIKGQLALDIENDDISIMDYLDDLEIEAEGMEFLAKYVSAFAVAVLAFDVGHQSGSAGYDINEEEERLFTKFIDSMRKFLLNNNLAIKKMGGFN